MAEGKDTEMAIVSPSGIDNIALTRSTATGEKITAMAASNINNVNFGTDGESPLLVFTDADLAKKVKWTQAGIKVNQGQVSSGNSRILVQRDVYEKFITAFRKYAECCHILGLVSTSSPSCARGSTTRQRSHGLFILPTIFADVADDIISFQEKIGPVVVISSFETEEQAVQRANDSPYGLGCATFTQ